MNAVTTVEHSFTPFIGQHQPITAAVVLASSGAEQLLQAGTVLGTVSASGKLVVLNPAGNDGSETASHVLAEDCTVPAASDALSTAYTHCEALERGLRWPAGITEPQKKAAIEALRAAGIFVTRNQPA
ncbi:head decoration protein [Oleidesulfovibrio alaskensis]|jgi:hypothetical protein|uniref:head decoration protein n=1 Tax=Oleidesulfovibrio alaskensis TaxID=58180 RepID=UPI001A3B86A1|nr:head decoration protein [Oleidesulfovibrio alaskensis]MBL3582616.1 head decoration protein [Oleidesulfovibrio alaskensis]